MAKDKMGELIDFGMTDKEREELDRTGGFTLNATQTQAIQDFFKRKEKSEERMGVLTGLLILAIVIYDFATLFPLFFG